MGAELMLINKCRHKIDISRFTQGSRMKIEGKVKCLMQELLDSGTPLKGTYQQWWNRDEKLYPCIKIKSAEQCVGMLDWGGVVFTHKGFFIYDDSKNPRNHPGLYFIEPNVSDELVIPESSHCCPR